LGAILGVTEEVEIDYDFLAQRALRRVVFDVLMLTAELGRAPGKHHFYIEFATPLAGVEMPADLRGAYPERMTIVLQHQFEDLTVEDEGFAVTLKFKGRPARLKVPFDAVTAFSDPGASFGLRFDAAVDAVDRETAIEETSPESAVDTLPQRQQAEGGAQIVSLDKFRKK